MFDFLKKKKQEDLPLPPPPLPEMQPMMRGDMEPIRAMGVQDLSIPELPAPPEFEVQHDFPSEINSLEESVPVMDRTIEQESEPHESREPLVRTQTPPRSFIAVDDYKQIINDDWRLLKPHSCDAV